MAAPSVFLSFSLNFPKETVQYYDIVNWVKGATRRLLRDGVAYGKMLAPGQKLRQDIAYEAVEVEGGLVGRVYMPWQLWFTLPPGTKAHPIPKGGAREQMDKGYPLRFYWVRVGKIVTFWSVSHPGYRGDDWDYRVFEKVDAELEKEMRDLGDHIAQRWGGDTSGGAGETVPLLGAGA